MTLAMTLGMSVGVRRTSYMMLGELLGVATVALASVLGVAAVLLQSPQVFTLMKIAGAMYLVWLGVNMFRSKGKLAIHDRIDSTTDVSRWSLFSQGLLTAVANPKGWAFMVSLLPPFINPELAFTPQVSVLICIILFSELICMLIYATGGKNIGRLLKNKNNVKNVNRFSGLLMMLVGVWLAVS